MSLDALVASSIDGLMLGFLYGLAAMGLTLIFGVMRVINLSHGPVIALGMFVILELTTRFGLSPYLALLFALSFGLGTMLAMASGGLLATLFSFTILSGGTYETKSFVIVVLGGLGNPTGALLGGVVLGLLEGVATIIMPVGWVPVFEYVIFVLILLLRPQGLLGRRA